MHSMANGTVEELLVRVDKNGVKSVKRIDSAGKVIKGKKGIVPGF